MSGVNFVKCLKVIFLLSPFEKLHHPLLHLSTLFVTLRIRNINIICVFLYLMCICCTMCIAVLTLDAGLLARSQYQEGPATGHLDTGFSWFPCVYKRMLRRFPSFQVATTCLSCSPPNLNSLVTFFPYLYTCKITTATG
jgi:hypothetical protein